jgi:GxxExxY protein
MSGIVDELVEIARHVYPALGSGHSEVAYQKAMEVGLRLRHVKFEAQKVLELKYQNHYVGECYVDILVSSKREKIVVELKATPTKMGAPERQQLRNYMKLLGIDKGLLINFTQPGRAAKAATSVEPEICHVGPEDDLGPADIHRNHTMKDAMATNARNAVAVFS